MSPGDEDEGQFDCPEDEETVEEKQTDCSRGNEQTSDMTSMAASSFITTEKNQFPPECTYLYRFVLLCGYLLSFKMTGAHSLKANEGN